MKNVFQFLKRYSNLLFFIALEVFAIYLIVSYNHYHYVVFSNSANKLTGSIDKKVSNVTNYFSLKKVNDSLVKANQALYNQLKTNYNIHDSSDQNLVAYMSSDSAAPYQNFVYKYASVVSNSVAQENNYLVLYGSNIPQTKKGMGVVSTQNGIVGQITEVDGNYAVVMSLLNRDSKISGKLLKTGETGMVTWTGKNAREVMLSGIPKTVTINKGDTLITSGLSSIFPKGILIGAVTKFTADEGSSNWLITVQPTAHFEDLTYAYCIQSKHADTVKKLLNPNSNKLQH